MKPQLLSVWYVVAILRSSEFVAATSGQMNFRSIVVEALMKRTVHPLPSLDQLVSADYPVVR